jgi:hypothetical protein
VPHEAVDCEAKGSHSPVAPPLQHPFGQLLLSHSQRPLTVSQRPFAHEVHAAPFGPHSVADCDA